MITIENFGNQKKKLDDFQHKIKSFCFYVHGIPNTINWFERNTLQLKHMILIEQKVWYYANNL